MNNPKGELIAYCQAQNLGRPEFLVEATGPNHKPSFTADVHLENESIGRAEATSKREAERLAASAALKLLRNEDTDVATEQVNTEAGPWPVFPEVLSRCLEIAQARTEPNKHGTSAIEEVRELALDLYKGLIRELGEYS